MKHAVSFVSILSLTVLVSGCDMMQMPDKMDQTKNLISATTEEVARTNTEVKKTNTQMGDMNDAVHKQVLLVAKNDMYDPKNTAMLVPVPFGMFAGGKTFAEKAYESELVDWFYAAYKQLRESTPNDKQRVPVPVLVPKFDASGNKYFEAQYDIQMRGDAQYAVPRMEWVFPQSYIDDFNNQLDITFNSMQVVASFIPQEMIEEMVAKEVGNGDLREQTVYMILNLRDAFTRGALLKNSLYEDKLTNLKQVSEAMRLTSNLEYIAGLDSVAEIAKTKIKGYLNVSESYVYAQQAKAADLALIQNIKLTPSTAKNANGTVSVQSTFTPVQVGFDPNAAANNPNQTSYTLNDDGLTVKAIDQGDVRTLAIKYDPKANMKDWKDLQNHFTRDLPKEVQLRGDAPALLAQIKSHVH